MNNVTLLCTYHSEFGKSNSDELYRILESIEPDVIFEELTEELFDKFYNKNCIPDEPPEVRSVKRYLKDNSIIHFPVDINMSSSVSTTEINYMFYVFKRYTTYSMLEQEQEKLVYEEGYEFLNSSKNEELTERKKSLEESLIAFQANGYHLARIHKLFYEEQHNREYEIIKNIYKFSENTVYKNAVLLLGSGHRRTVFNKMESYKSDSHVMLNWKLYGS